jgi:hypothetical protein
MIIQKIPIQKYEEMKYRDLDSKRATIDHAVATTVNDMIEELKLDRVHRIDWVKVVIGLIVIGVIWLR